MKKRVKIVFSFTLLAISLCLIKKMGIVGLLIGTIVSIVISELIFKAKVIHKKILNQTSKLYYIRLIMNTIYLVSISVIADIIIPNNYSSLRGCIFLGILVTFFNLIVTILYLKITNQLHFMKRIKFFVDFTKNEMKK